MHLHPPPIATSGNVPFDLAISVYIERVAVCFYCEKIVVCRRPFEHSTADERAGAELWLTRESGNSDVGLLSLVRSVQS